MKKEGISIGIFGGSFNPIHNGHLIIARAMLTKKIVDEVHLIISPQNPLKNPKELLTEETRYHLAQMACENEKGIIASNFEFSLPRPSYTWQTLEALQVKFPKNKFKLLIGADNWALFDKWYKADDIIKKYAIAIYPREGYNIDTNSLPEKVEYINMPLYNISSTKIRRLIKENKDISKYVPLSVCKEIKFKNLYL